MAKSKSNGNYWLVIILSTIIASVLAGFFLIYVPENEDRITERNFRELNRVSDNLRTRAKSLIKNARNVVQEKEVSKKVLCTLYGLEEKDSSKVFLKIADSLNKNINKFNSDISFREVDVVTVEANHDESFNQGKIELHVNTPNPTTVLYSDRVRLKELAGNSNIVCSSEKPKTQETVSPDTILDKVDATHLSYKIEIAAPDLIEDLLHFDFFENFILSTNGWLIYESNPVGTLFFEEFLDSVSGSTQTKNTRVKNVTINGIQYKAYVRPIHISKTQHWNLVGFIRADEAREESWKISPKASLILLVISILVLLALTLIKLKTINNQEKVNTLDVILAYFSIVSLTSLITIIMYSFYVFQFSEIQKKESLKYLKNEIQDAFGLEYDEISKFLVEMQANTLDDTNNFSPLDANSNHKNLFSKYRFLEDYFVIDSAGNQEKKWTVRKHRTPKFNVKSRDYVSRLFNKTGYKMDPPHLAQMYLESIVSFNTGQQLAVITRMENDSNKIFGITSKLHSLYDTVLPYGFRFSIIDKNGLVHFHSNSDKNLNENFFDEARDPESVRKRIKNNNLGYTSINYHGEKTAAHFSSLHDNLPLYLVVIGDKSLQYGVFARVLRVTISLTILIILMFFGVVYLKAYLKHKPASYDSWLRPISVDKRLTYEWGWGIVFLGCVLIPILIFNFSYNREMFTLNKLTETKTAELLAEKEFATKEYIAWLGEGLNSSKYNTLYNIHATRMCRGNYFFPPDSANSYTAAGHFSFAAFSDFDHDMNNAFRAYKESSLFSGTREQQVLVQGQVMHNTALTQFTFNTVTSWFAVKPWWFVLLAGALSAVFFGAVFTFRRVKKRLFKVEIQKKEDWAYSEEKFKWAHNGRFFVVDVSGEAFRKNTGSSGNKNYFECEWKEFAENNLLAENAKETQIRLFNFPSSFEEIKDKDAEAMKTLVSSKTLKDIIVVCKQSPALLMEEAEEVKAQEKSENDGNQKTGKMYLYKRLLEFLSTFDTYYQPVEFTEKERDAVYNKKLKTRMTYQKRFDNLNKNEQYLLYDLAEDGIINTKNTEIINALFKKGIIKGTERRRPEEEGKEQMILTRFYFFDRDEEVVNNGIRNDEKDEQKQRQKGIERTTFREFVLNTFDEGALKEFKSEVESRSNWAKYRTFILFVMGGLFLFILLTQQQYLNELIAIITSLVGIFGLIAKLTTMPSLFGGKNKAGANKITE